MSKTYLYAYGEISSRPRSRKKDHQIYRKYENTNTPSFSDFLKCILLLLLFHIFSLHPPQMALGYFRHIRLNYLFDRWIRSLHTFRTLQKITLHSTIINLRFVFLAAEPISARQPALRPHVHKQPEKTTRVRTVLNEKQLHTLRTCYNANPRPDALMKEQLVEMTGLSPRVIRVWFQNKRCKDKKRSILMKQLQQQQPNDKTVRYKYCQAIAI